MLNGLEKPTSGQIVVNDKEITSISEGKLRQVRHKVSMIFQHFNLLWSRTVAENIAFPLEIAGVPKEQRATRVKELIELVGLEGRGDYYPSQLSGGGRVNEYGSNDGKYDSSKCTFSRNSSTILYGNGPHCVVERTKIK